MKTRRSPNTPYVVDPDAVRRSVASSTAIETGENSVQMKLASNQVSAASQNSLWRTAFLSIHDRTICSPACLNESLLARNAPGLLFLSAFCDNRNDGQGDTATRFPGSVGVVQRLWLLEQDERGFSTFAGVKTSRTSAPVAAVRQAFTAASCGRTGNPYRSRRWRTGHRSRQYQ